MKWIDEIADDFVNDMFNKSQKPTDLEKAQEVFEYIGSKTPEELAEEMNISSKDWNLGCAWQYASHSAYLKMWRYLRII